MLATASTGASGGRIHDISLVHKSGKYLAQEKFDGIRVLVYINHKKITLETREGVDVTNLFPDVVERLRVKRPVCVLDGELTHPDGVRAVQRAVASKVPVTGFKLQLFDVPFVEGGKLLKLEDRLDLLAQIVTPSASVAVAPWTLDIEGKMREVTERGGEGIIAKRLGSPYEQKRSPHWLKFKQIHELAAVVTSYTEKNGNLTTLGVSVLDKGKQFEIATLPSGWTQHEGRALLHKIKNSRRPLVVNVKYVPSDKALSLKFPIYDKPLLNFAPTDAKANQIITINPGG